MSLSITAFYLHLGCLDLVQFWKSAKNMYNRGPTCGNFLPTLYQEFSLFLLEIFKLCQNKSHGPRRYVDSVAIEAIDGKRRWGA